MGCGEGMNCDVDSRHQVGLPHRPGGPKVLRVLEAEKPRIEAPADARLMSVSWPIEGTLSFTFTWWKGARAP